ncbi:hypothetical protein K438DRAFT_1783678, partial [Mycena galopus ATCC 62051]
GVIVVRVSTSRRRDTSTAIYPATSAETPPQIKAHKKRPKTAYKYSYKKGIAIGLWSLLIFRNWVYKTAPLVLDSDVREEGDDDDDPDPLTPGYEPVNLLEEVNDEQ